MTDDDGTFRAAMRRVARTQSAARAAYLGLELPPVDSNHEAPGSEPGGSASSPRGHQHDQPTDGHA